MVWVAICKRCQEPWLTAARNKSNCLICGAKATRFRDGIELPDHVRWSGAYRRRN